MIQVVQSAQGTISNTAAGTITLSSATTAGNTLIALAAYYGASGSVNATGWTLSGAAGNFTQRVSSQPSGGPFTTIWECPLIAGGGSLAGFQMSGAGYAAVDVYEVSGLTQSGAYLHASSQSGTTGTGWNSGTISQLGANATFVAGIGAAAGTVTGPPSDLIPATIPWANQGTQQWGSGGTIGAVAGYGIVSGTNRAYYYPGTATASGHWDASVASFAGALAPVAQLPMFTAGVQVTPAYLDVAWAQPLAFAQQRMVFRATQTNTATAVSTSETQLLFDTILEDPWLGWDPNLGGWYTTVTGYFQVTMTVFTGGASANNVSLAIQTSASPVIASVPLPPVASGQGGAAVGTWFLQQAAFRDGIVVYASVSSGSVSTSLVSGAQSSLEIMYIATT